MEELLIPKDYIVDSLVDGRLSSVVLERVCNSLDADLHALPEALNVTLLLPNHPIVFGEPHGWHLKEFLLGFIRTQKGWASNYQALLQVKVSFTLFFSFHFALLYLYQRRRTLFHLPRWKRVVVMACVEIFLLALEFFFPPLPPLLLCLGLCSFEIILKQSPLLVSIPLQQYGAPAPAAAPAVAGASDDAASAKEEKKPLDDAKKEKTGKKEKKAKVSEESGRVDCYCFEICP